MATQTLPPELSSMAQFRASLPQCSPDSVIADRLCAIGHFRSLKKGEELVAGQQDNLLVFIADGHAKLLARSTDDKVGGTQILAFHFPGDIISVVRQSGGDICLGALDKLELIVFDTNQFLDMAQDEPAVIRAVLAKSLHALQRSRTKVVQLGNKTAQQRLAGFLLSIAGRLSDCETGECIFDLPMARSDIADSLGLTIETVSRQFTELRNCGLVTTTGRSRVCVHDLDALRQLAGP